MSSFPLAASGLMTTGTGWEEDAGGKRGKRIGGGGGGEGGPTTGGGGGEWEKRKWMLSEEEEEEEEEERAFGQGHGKGRERGGGEMGRRWLDQGQSNFSHGRVNA